MNTFSTYIAPKSITDPTAVNGNNAQVKKAAQDFEAMFVTEMLRPMFESQEINPEFGGGSSEKIYRSMLVDEYGKGIAKAGGIGIAKHVEAELLRLQETKITPNSAQNTLEKSNDASK